MLGLTVSYIDIISVILICGQRRGTCSFPQKVAQWRIKRQTIFLVKSGGLPDLLLCVANSADTLMTYYRQLAVPAVYINILNKFQGKGNWSCCLFLDISCKASQSLCVPLNSTYY